MTDDNYFDSEKAFREAEAKSEEKRKPFTVSEPVKLKDPVSLKEIKQRLRYDFGSALTVSYPQGVTALLNAHDEEDA